MAKGLQTLLKQIERLQQQADVLRQKEKVGVIARIKEAIAHYDITSEELFAKAPPVKRAASKARAPATPFGKKKTGRPAKFADGQGNTWSGMGKRPDWFKAALAAGKQPEELLVSK